MSMYRCFFDAPDGMERCTDHPGGPRMFSDGFWVTVDYKFTHGYDCIYWIPPSMILYIEKLKDE